MANSVHNIQLLQASVDTEDTSEFRILVNNQFVKYITIDAGVFEQDEMCFAPSFVLLLPPLPAGDWNTGFVSRNPNTGEAYFADVRRERLPGVTRPWHPIQVDHLELSMGKKVRSNIYEATCSRFGSPVIVKLARFSWEIPQLEAETRAYEWIDGHHIAPDFLGHLVEEGRIIGFMISRIEDFHHATPDDFSVCCLALSKLHRLGIRHGDVNKHNFLVHDGEVTIIDFDNASQSAAVDELEDEISSLRQQLKDTSGRGGRTVETITEQ